MVAHAGTLYDFDNNEYTAGVVPGSIPILQLGSAADQTAPVGRLRELHDTWASDSYLAVFEYESHLGWLDPTSARFPESVAITEAFFDRYLRDEPVDLAEVAAGGEFAEFSQNTDS